MGSAQRDELVVERVGEAWVLRLVGDHDLVNEGVLQAEIEAVFARGSVVLVDLSAATFIDSTIMSVFVRGARLADEEPDHAFAVCAPPGTEPRRVLDLVSLGEIVPMFDDAEQALQAVSRPPPAPVRPQVQRP